MNTTHLDSIVVGPSVPAHSVARSRPLLLPEGTMYREGRTSFTSTTHAAAKGAVNLTGAETR
jgi:hypothetical protein